MKKNNRDSIDYAFCNKTTVTVPVNGRAMVKSECYVYYNILNLLLHKINGKTISFLIGSEARRTFNFLTRKRDISERELEQIVKHITGIGASQVKSRTRQQYVVWARNMYIWYLSYISDQNHVTNFERGTSLKVYSLHDICAVVGYEKKDHASVLHAIKSINIKPDDEKYLKPWQKKQRRDFIDYILTLGHKIELA